MKRLILCIFVFYLTLSAIFCGTWKEVAVGQDVPNIDDATEAAMDPQDYSEEKISQKMEDYTDEGYGKRRGKPEIQWDKGEDKLEDVIPPYKSKDEILNEEADREGIPQDQKLFYQTRKKELDRQYQEGALTKTEYIQRKRELIKLCK